jgi:hypothetical protein
VTVTKGKDTKLGRESTVEFKDVNFETSSNKHVYVNEAGLEHVSGATVMKQCDYQGELFNTTSDAFMQCVGNILHLFTTTRFVF